MTCECRGDWICPLCEANNLSRELAETRAALARVAAYERENGEQVWRGFALEALNRGGDQVAKLERELTRAWSLLERSLAMMEATYEYDNDAVSEKMGVVMADVRTYLAYGQSARVSEPSCGCVFCDIDASHSTEECTRADQGAP